LGVRRAFLLATRFSVLVIELIKLIEVQGNTFSILSSVF